MQGSPGGTGPDLTRLSLRELAVPSHSNLYASNLPPEIDSQDALREFFDGYGPIETLRLVRSSKLPAGKSFAFIKFVTIDDAIAAIQGLNGQSVEGGGVMEVKFADADAGERNPELSAPPSDNLYVKNLPPAFLEAELRALFASCGEVVECRLLHKGDGSQGAGALVRMGSVEEAGGAVAHLHGQRLAGAAAPLVVRYADSPEQKAKKQARQGRQQAERSASLPSSVSSAPSGGLSSQGPQSSLGSSSSAATTIAVTAAAALALAPVPELLGEAGGSICSSGPTSGPSSSGGVILRGPSAAPAPYSPTAYTPPPYTPAYMHGAAPGAMPVPGYQAAGAAIGMYGGAAAYGATYAYPPQQPPPAGVAVVRGQQQQQQPPPLEAGPAPNYAGPPAGAGMSYGASSASAGGSGGSGGGAPPGSSIYIKHLPEQTDKLFLYEKFAPFGSVLSVKVMVHEATGQCRGIGFVNYGDPDAAARAVAAMHSMPVGDRRLHVSIQTHRHR